MGGFSPGTLQAGVPELLQSVVGLAGALVLLLIVIAVVGVAYKHATGGIEWPDEDEEEESDDVKRGGDDDEWDYY